VAVVATAPATAMFFHRLSVVRARHVVRILLDSASADNAPLLRSDGAPLVPAPTRADGKVLACDASAAAVAAARATAANTVRG